MHRGQYRDAAGVLRSLWLTLFNVTNCEYVRLPTLAKQAGGDDNAHDASIYTA